MKILLAIDSFKGCLSSVDAEKAALDGIRAYRSDIEVVCMPVSDGGEGMLNAFSQVLDAEIKTAQVRNAMMQYVDAHYGLKDDLAIIEVAEVIGLCQIPKIQRNPLVATSYGVGQLMTDAYKHGARRFIIGLGGTATSDCGLGMLKALKDLKSLDEMKSLEITLASDVENPLCGANGAAAVFAAQKGADREMIKLLERRAETFAEMSARHCGHDESHKAGAGAGGGLGYAFMQFLNAKMQSGADMLMQLAHLDEMLPTVDMVVTGEGCVDSQTLMGKFPYKIMKLVKRAHIPTIVLGGSIEAEEKLLDAGF